MVARVPVDHALRIGFVVLVSLVLLAGCVGISGPNDTPTPGDGPKLGDPITDYETFVFDSSPSETPVIEGGIEVEDEFDEQYYATLLTNTTEMERFNRSLLPADAREFVDTVSFEEELLVVIQTFPASSAPDYRVETVARDGPTLHLEINDSSAGGTEDVTVETLLVRVPGETPDNVIVTTEEGTTFETAGDS